MGHPGREIGEPALVAFEDLITDADLVLALEDVDRLLLPVVNMQRGAPMRRNLDDEVVKGSTGVFASDLEDQVATWTKTLDWFVVIILRLLQCWPCRVPGPVTFA